MPQEVVLQAWKTQEGQAVPRSWHCGPGELKGDRLCPREGGTAGLEDSGGQAVPRRRWHRGHRGLGGAGCAQVALRASRLPRVLLSQG